jgi:hypothetical protein
MKSSRAPVPLRVVRIDYYWAAGGLTMLLGLMIGGLRMILGLMDWVWRAGIDSYNRIYVSNINLLKLVWRGLAARFMRLGGWKWVERLASPCLVALKT